mmetsp:Transcript_10101/g.20865  ORF Transcript_10101/g.20865 Transcript_10101/m.20865 type:complete len:82 (+) Transcript_10101:1756-2001(+)
MSATFAHRHGLKGGFRVMPMRSSHHAKIKWLQFNIQRFHGPPAADDAGGGFKEDQHLVASLVQRSSTGHVDGLGCVANHFL